MAKIQTGQTIHLMGGDSGTVQDIRDMSEGKAYQVEIDGELHWVGESVIKEAQLEQQSKPVCHYCGMPATDWGFFGAPVCSDCR